MPRFLRIVVPLVLALLLVMPVSALQDTDDDSFDTFGAEPRALPDDVIEMVVLSITDGDTLRLTLPDDDWYENVRIVGIDTPENDGPYTDEECYGEEATDALETLLPVGTYVYVEIDEEEEDRNGRWLRHLWLPFAENGVDVEDEAYLVSEILVLGGFADARAYRPNEKYDDILQDAEQESRDDDLGLWGAC